MTIERRPAPNVSHARALLQRRIRRRVLATELVVATLATAFVLVTGTLLSALAGTVADVTYEQSERR